MFVSPIVAAELIEEVSSPALAPAGEPIDLDHLSRMTLGERSREREVLALFDRQADILLERMNSAARWRSMHWPITVPAFTSSATNSVVVPWRL